MSREVPGFFFLGIDGKYVNHPSMQVPGVGALPMQFPSIERCKRYIQEVFGVSLDKLDVMQQAEGFPVAWSTVIRTDREVVITIVYVGSFQYHSGKRVDPLLVGTDQEMFE